MAKTTLVAGVADGHRLGAWAWVERVVLVFTLLSVAVGSWAFYLDFQDRHTNRANLAWQTVSQPSPGNNGKVPALEYLFNARYSISGLDLSCHRLDQETEPAFGCREREYLRFLNLANGSGQDRFIDGVNFQGADLYGCNFENVRILNTSFRDAFMAGCQFESVQFYNRFRMEFASGFHMVDFINSDIEMLFGGGLVSNRFLGSRVLIRGGEQTSRNILGNDFENSRVDILCGGPSVGFRISGNNFSGATVTVGVVYDEDGTAVECESRLSQGQNWYWEDNPPQLIAGIDATMVRACDPGLSGENRAAYEARHAELRSEFLEWFARGVPMGTEIIYPDGCFDD